MRSKTLCVAVATVSLLLAVTKFKVTAQQIFAAHYNFSEERPPESMVGHLPSSIRLFDTKNSTIRYSLAKASTFFRVEGSNGTIYSTRKIDRETLADLGRSTENEVNARARAGSARDVGTKGRDELRCATSGRSLTSVCVFQLHIWAHDVSRPSEPAVQVQVSVEITDVNDNAPKWSSESQLVRFHSGKTFEKRRLPTASDVDQAENARINYALHAPDDSTGRHFQLVITHGAPYLTIRRQLSRESTYHLQLLAIDNGTPKLTGTLSISVSCNEMSSSPPKFDRQEYAARIAEDAPVDSVVFELNAHDNDTDQALVYSIGAGSRLHEKTGLPFEVDARTGLVRLTRPIDHESRKEYVFDVEVSDGLYTDTAVLRVSVDDVNDNSPNIRVVRFRQTPDAAADFSFRVMENEIQKEIGLFEISDADAGLNAQVDCRLSDPPLSDSPPAKFVLNTLGDDTSGSTLAHLVALGTFDREAQSQHLIAIECFDKASKVQRSSVAILTIHVDDANDNAPTFNQSVFNVQILENNAINAQVARLVASDNDVLNTPNSNVTYSLRSTNILIDKYLKIDPITGAISAKIAFDREKLDRLQFSVIAHDNGATRLSSSADVEVIVIDTNDCVPLFERPVYFFSVNENNLPVEPIGRLSAYDDDSDEANTNLAFRLVDLPSAEIRHISSPNTNLEDKQITVANNLLFADYFRIDDFGQLFLTKPLDAEISREIHLQVSVSNFQDFHESSSASIVVSVIDANDNAPNFIFPNQTYNLVQLPRIEAGQKVAILKAVDDDFGRNADITYSIMTPNSSFHIDEVSGQIYAVEDLQLDLEDAYKLLVRASDRGSPENSKIATLNIYVAPLQASITSASVSPATVAGFSWWLASHQIALVTCTLSGLCILTFAISSFLFWSNMRKKQNSAAARTSKIEQDEEDKRVSLIKREICYDTPRATIEVADRRNEVNKDWLLRCSAYSPSLSVCMEESLPTVEVHDVLSLSREEESCYKPSSFASCSSTKSEKTWGQTQSGNCTKLQSSMHDSCTKNCENFKLPSSFCEAEISVDIDDEISETSESEKCRVFHLPTNNLNDNCDKTYVAKSC